MKHEVSYQVQAERGAVVEHIRAYLECVGYHYAQEGDELVFRRGSLLGSMVGFTPVQWQATVRARVVQTPNRHWKASFSYQINTGLQQVTRPEADFWNCEVDGLERAVSAAAREASPAAKAAVMPQALEGLRALSPRLTSKGSGIILPVPQVEVNEEAAWAAVVRTVGREAEMNNWRTVARLVVMPLALIPFIIAFCIGIEPMVSLARQVATQTGSLAVIGSLTAALLIAAGAGMYWLPGLRPVRVKSPVDLLVRTAGQSAYYGMFALVIFSGLFALAEVEGRLSVVLLIALSVIGTAMTADQARRR